MDHQKRLSLLNRQITDLLAQAERILGGKDSPEALETFARFSEELKSFVLTKMEEESLSESVRTIPIVDYTKTEIQLWQYVIMPSWWISIYKDYQQRQKVVEEVREVRAAYSEFQLKVQEVIFQLER